MLQAQSQLKAIYKDNADTIIGNSPMGLPLVAIWLLGKVQDLKFAIQDWMYG